MGFPICTVKGILCPQTLDSSEEKFHVDGKKEWKKLQEEPQRMDPSSMMDSHAIDVVFTSYNNRKSETSYM